MDKEQDGPWLEQFPVPHKKPSILYLKNPFLYQRFCSSSFLYLAFAFLKLSWTALSFSGLVSIS